MGYYQGDYYAGDPGLFSFLGKVGKIALSAGKAQLGIVPTGPKLAKIAAPAAAGISAVGMGRTAVQKVTSTIVKHPVMSAAGAAGVIGAGGLAAGRMTKQALDVGAGMRMHPGMRGMHISRRTGQMVRNKRMNPCNIHALRKAIRRASSFSRIAKKVLRFTSPRPPKGRFAWPFRESSR